MMTAKKTNPAKPAKKATELPDTQMDVATGGFSWGEHNDVPPTKVRAGGVRPVG